ncbi:MAG TPA: hypothetical protein VJ455_07805 [Ignavibacteria bacterium]|nr:hypothetical protein [Ignavibacteria bacterium]
MIKFFTAFLFLFVLTINSRADNSSFTLSAEVTRSSNVNLETDFIAKYIKNLDIYPKFFPNITSVVKLSDSTSEWTYKVVAPLATPYDVKFVLVDKSPSLDTLLFESIVKIPDYLYCNAVLTKISDTKTNVNFLFKISMTREKASDIHFLAGILGEKFLSEKMKERLESDLEDFISSAVKDMYLTSRLYER